MFLGLVDLVMITKFNLGIPEIDRQHAVWIDLAEKFRGQVDGHFGDTSGADAALKTLEELLNYTKAHFASEETLMAASGYKGLAAHTGMHRTITDALEKLLGDARADLGSTPLKLHLFLTIWLMEHIATEDRKYALQCNTAPASF